MPPPKLLLLLRNCGVNLCPIELDAKSVPAVTAKERGLERECTNSQSIRS